MWFICCSHSKFCLALYVLHIPVVLINQNSRLQPGPDVCNAQRTRASDEEDAAVAAAVLDDGDDDDGDGNAEWRRRHRSSVDEAPTKRRKSEEN